MRKKEDYYKERKRTNIEDAIKGNQSHIMRAT